MILLVDADLRFAHTLLAALRRNGFAAAHRLILEEGMELATGADLVLLDIDQSDGAGLRACRDLRRRGEGGVILLTGRTDPTVRVAGLRAGADDCVTREMPFTELQARIDAVLRRRRSAANPVHRVGALLVDAGAHAAYLDGQPVALSRKEFQLLLRLARVPGVVHRRERLMLDVWGPAWGSPSRTLDVHVATLRAKLAGAAGVEIRTVRGVGYRLDAAPRPSIVERSR